MGFEIPIAFLQKWYGMVLPCLDTSSTLQLIAALGLEPSKFITCHNQGTELSLASALVKTGYRTSWNLSQSNEFTAIADMASSTSNIQHDTTCVWQP